MLVDYEKKFLTVLQKVLDEIDVDLTELEKNFLDGEIFGEIEQKESKHFSKILQSF